jgi:hypothetical protein
LVSHLDELSSVLLSNNSKPSQSARNETITLPHATMYVNTGNRDNLYSDTKSKLTIEI